MGRNLQKTLSSYQQVPEAKISFWKQSVIGASFKESGPKNQEDARAENPRWREKSERPLAVSLTICEVNEINL